MAVSAREAAQAAAQAASFATSANELVRMPTEGSSSSEPKASLTVFTQEHVGARFVVLPNGQVMIFSTTKKRNVGKKSKRIVVEGIWPNGHPPNLCGKPIDGIVRRVTEQSVQLASGQAIPNPMACTRKQAKWGKWQRLELHLAGLLTNKQCQRQAAAAAGGANGSAMDVASQSAALPVVVRSSTHNMPSPVHNDANGDAGGGSVGGGT